MTNNSFKTNLKNMTEIVGSPKKGVAKIQWQHHRNSQGTGFNKVLLIQEAGEVWNITPVP